MIKTRNIMDRLVPSLDHVALAAAVHRLKEANAWLVDRNATLEQIVTQRAQSNATRQRAYRARRKANG